MSNLQYWDALRTPPQAALKTIQYGNLKGKSDINPQWRMQAMTETFGSCGLGWYYEKVKDWISPELDGQIAAFVDINLYICIDGQWSMAIPGTGGSMLIIKDKNGLHINDEAWKMATTDALSVAMKQLGVAADIYMGIYDGSKYQEPRNVAPQTVAGVNIHDEAWDLFDSLKDGLNEKQRQWCMDELNKGNAHVVLAKLKEKEPVVIEILKARANK